MNEARRCACERPLKDGARCAKCGKPLPDPRRPRPPALDGYPPMAADPLADPTPAEVDDYDAHLADLMRE